MNTNLTDNERQAILLVNAYGVDVALKVTRNQKKFYQMNATETDRLVRVENALLGIQNKKVVK